VIHPERNSDQETNEKLRGFGDETPGSHAEPRTNENKPEARNKKRKDGNSGLQGLTGVPWAGGTQGTSPRAADKSWRPGGRKRKGEGVWTWGGMETHEESTSASVRKKKVWGGETSKNREDWWSLTEKQGERGQADSARDVTKEKIQKGGCRNLWPR